jgi:hypothetical protein
MSPATERKHFSLSALIIWGGGFVMDTSTMFIAVCSLILILALRMQTREMEEQVELLLKRKHMRYANAR